MDNLGISVTNEQLNPLIPISDPLILSSFNSIGNKLDPTITLPLLAPPTFSESPLRVGGISNDSLFLGVSNTSLLKSAGSASDLFPTAPIPEGMGIVQRASNVATLESPGTIATTIDLPPQLPTSTTTNTQQLTPEILTELKSAAIARWASLGLSTAEVEKLQGTKLVVDDLASNTLAETQGYTIILDWDASGIGWYVDATPLDNAEFTQQVSATELVANGDSVAFRKVDLLSAIAHEYGHILGLEHSETDALMKSTIPIGERLLPSLKTLQGIRQNGVVSDRVDLAGANVDLQANGVTATDNLGNSLTTVNFGQAFNVTWNISQIGLDAITAGTWQDRIYLSKDSIISTDDINIVNKNQNRTLASNGQYLDSAVIMLDSNNILPVDVNGFVYATGSNNSVATALYLQQNFLPTNEANTYLVLAKGSISTTSAGDYYRIVGNPGDSLQIFSDEHVELLDRQGNIVATNVGNGYYASSEINYQLPSNVLSEDYYIHVIGNGYYDSSYNLTIQLQSTTLLVSNSITPGNYYLLVQTDGGNGILEGNETNNLVAATTPINLSNTSAPDLSIVGFAPATPVDIQSTIPISWTVTNALNADPTRSGWFDYVYLSNDQILDDSDVELTSSIRNIDSPSLGAGESYTIQADVSVTVELTGRNYLIFVTDRTNSKSERNETNNQSIVSIDILAPDLTVTSIIAPSQAIVGSNIDLTWTVTNQGDGSALNYWNDQVYLSDDNIIDNNDTIIANIANVGTLAASNSYTNTRNITLPTQATGDKYLIVVANSEGSQTESDNTNNYTFIPITIQIPDLQADQIISVDNLNNSLSNIYFGQQFNVKWDVSQVGLANIATSTWQDRLYLSKDSILSADDINIGNKSQNRTLAVNGRYADVASVSINYNNPLPVDVNGFVSELEPNNSIATALDLQQNFLPTTGVNNYLVKAKGSISTAGDGDYYQIIASPGDRMLVNQIGFDTYLFLYDRNGNLLTSDDDSGGGGASYINYQLPTNAYTGGYYIKAAGYSSSIGNYNLTVELKTVTPITTGNVKPGDYYLLLKTDGDNGIVESNESNNIIISTAPIHLDAASSDLSIIGVAPTTPVSRGSTIPISWTVTNALNADLAIPTWVDSVYLSDDQTLDNNDIILTSVERGNDRASLGAGESYTAQTNITLPIGVAGQKYLIFVTDRTNSKSERDETNNQSIVSIDILAPDLSILGTVPTNSAYIQSIIPLSWTVTNALNADTATSGWSDYVYLSDDQTLDNNDFALTSATRNINLPNLGAGESYSLQANVTLPVGVTGNKYLIFVTDRTNSRIERNETNNQSVVAIDIVAPDLTITTSPTIDRNTASPNETVALTWQVTNTGTAATNRTWRERIYLSTDETFSGDDVWLGDFGNLNALGAGESYTRTGNVNISNIAGLGNRYVLVVTDAYNEQLESNNNNNANATTLQIAITDPDLTITSVFAPSQAPVGNTIGLSWTVLNQGNGKALGAWSDRVYLSDDNIFDTSDILLNTTANASTLSGNSSYTILQQIALPTQSVGNKYLIVRTNSNGTQSESDVTNNYTFAPITIQAPDLHPDRVIAVDNLGNSLSNIDFGQQFNVNWDVSQIGSGNITTGNWQDRLYLSRDLILSSDDINIFNQNQSRILAANSQYTDTASVIINYNNPLPVDVNGFVSELEPNNSILTALDLQQNFLPTTGVNNYLVKAKGSISSSYEGDYYRIIASPGDRLIMNQTGNYDTYLYLYDRNGTLLTADDDSGDGLNSYINYQLPTNAYAGDYYIRAAGYSSSTGNYNLTVQLQSAFSIITGNITPGDYYLLLKADGSNLLVEDNEANNVIASTTPISLNAYTRPDLSIVGSAPATPTYIQSTIPISWTVTNDINADIARSGWFDYVYLSDDQTLDNSDVALTSATRNIDLPSLGAGESYSLQANVTLPIGVTGNKYLIFVTDRTNSRIERNETNNQSVVAVNIVAPDLTITTSPTIDRTTASPNETVALTWQVTNTGTAATNRAWTERLYLSTDATFSGDDVWLGDFGNLNALGAGESYTRTGNVNIANIAGLGNRYVLVVTDAYNEQLESNNNNNANATTLPIAISDPDLTVTSIVAPSQAPVGNTIGLSWTVLNRGSGKALSTWTDSVYLSDNDRLDGNDILISNKSNLNALDSNGSYISSQNITLPIQSIGNKYLIVRTNNYGSQSENDGTNNYFFVPINIQAPDLTINNLIAPTIGKLGEKIMVSWQVTNTSQIDAVSGWNDRIYLSKDNVLDNNDILLTSKSQANLAGGANYTGSAELTVPDVTLGNYYLIAATDRDGRQLEIDESNNTTLAQIQLQYPDYTDLIVDTISTSPTGTSGENVNITWRVSNQGQLVTNTSNWVDRIYVSSKSSFDNTAIALGTIARTGNLNPGDNYLQTATVKLPNGISGNYYVFVITDANNQVGEYKFEGNNTTVAAQPINVTRKPDPNLVVTNLSYDGNGQPGQKILVNWTVNNSGVGVAKGNWNDRVYLTNTAGTIDILLQTKPTPNQLLGIGENYNHSVEILLPTNLADGEYRIAVVTNADDTIFEGDGAGDNRTISGLILVGHPDIAVAVDPTPITATSGTTIPIVWNVQNLGTANTLTDWQDRVYLGNNPTFDSSAVLLGSLNHTGTLAVNSSYQGQLNLNLPIDLQGRHYLFIKTDAGQQLNELGSTTNNLTVIPIDVTLAPYADLAVSHVTAPELVVRDPATIDVSWQVSNQGTGVGITTTWIDQIILSGDDTIGNGDDLVVGEFTHTGGLAVGDSYTRSETLNLPPALTGTYRVFVRSDTGNAVFENGSESNNAAKAERNLTVTPIPYADLVLSSLQLNGTASSGKNINVSWQVDNQGIGTTNTDSLGETVSLATDPQGQNIIQTLGNFTHLGAIGVGGKYERAVDLKLANGLSGTYYLVVRVNTSTPGAFELGKTANNTQIIPIQVTLTPAPDLVVKSINAPTNLQSGDRFDLTWEVQNSGTGNTDDNWVDSVYLQEIGKPDNLIKLQDYTYNRILESGKSYSRTESFKLSDTIQGQYQVLVKTNSASGLYESTLVNNSNTSAPVQIVYPTRPDLIVSEIISPDIVDAGGTITAEIVIKNQGTSNANGSWNDLVYLSSDDKIDGGDILLGSFENVTALTPGSSYRLKTDSVTVPKYLRGNAFIIVKTDTGNTISEIPHEDNNTLYKNIAINDIKPADLVTGNVIVPEQAFAGSQVDVRYRVTNLGVAETITDKWTDSIWLAPGKNLQSLAASGSAIKLTDIGHTGSLKVGESYEAVVRVTLPTGIDGQYFLTPWSDTYNVVLEDIFDINKNPDDPNEVDNNNYKAAQINILNRPALLLLPDIAVSNVISTPQKVVGSTDILNVSWTGKNIGVLSAPGGWRDTIYLADAPTLSAATSYWGVGSVIHQGNLEIGESYTGSFSQQVAPTMVGKYAIVVSEFIDQTPANNISSGTTDINTILPADLVVSSVTTNPTSFSNETVNVSWTVKNQGANVWDGTKYWYDEVWFSADPTFIPGRAKFVGTFLHDNTQSLAGGASYSNSTTYTLPAGIDGKYYFYVSTDYGYSDPRYVPISRGNLGSSYSKGGYPQFTSQVFENPANNLKATNLQVTYREPDLQVTQVTDPGALTAGDKLSLNWQVSNLGGRVTRESSWRDAVFLSKDKSLDVSDLMLAVSDHSGSLNVGGSYDLTSAIKLPIDLMVGDYYLLFGTDLQKIPQYRRDSSLLVGKNSGGPEYTTVPEFQDEGNNIRAQAVTIVEPVLPDLKVTNVIVPERGIAGQGFEIGYTVKNAGIEATKVIIPPDPRNPLVLPTLWSDNVYLSKDRFLDTTIDQYVGSVARTSNLAANDTYAVTQRFDLPKDLTGAYYLFIVTDGGNTVYEGARELNNALESVQPILIDLPPAADLRVEDIVVPTGGRSGEAAQIKFTVANRSANPAKGTWSDAVYLSSDANWDIKDRYLGRVTHSGDLVQDATYTSTLTANLPALTPGQYRIIVRTDAQNQVYEGDNEVNNLTTAATPLNLAATELPLNQLLTTTLATGQERLYHIVLPKGETLKVSVSGDLTAQNEVFIRYGQAPTSAEYDATYVGITNGSPSAIIPGSQAGDYYILVRGQSTAKIKAELLPFGVTDVVTDRGGDGRYVTAQILGAKFQAGAIVKLIRPGIEEVLPVNVQTIDSTKITAIFDLSNVTHGLYDIKVINPDGNEAILPYRYQVERAIAPDVTVGLTGKRVLELEEFATYGISVKSISNLDAPYVQFKYGLPALGTNSKLGIPYTPSNTNLRGNPSNSLTDMPWAELTSDLNANGEILSTGYIYDFPTGGYIGQNLNLQVYPDILTKFPGIDDPKIYYQDYFKAYPAEYIAFVSHITVSATALTRAEFVAQQQKEALRLRSGILADTTATAALKLLAVDADTWVQSYLGALESVGLLRAVDATPPIRTRTLVASMLSTLATGVLLGNAGQKLVSTGDLVGFFANVRKWYGEDTKLAIDPEFNPQVVNLPAPDAQQLDLRATSPTHTQGISIYVPFMYMGVDAAYGSAAANSFGNFFQAAGKVGTEATITGPENFTSTDTPQTYTIQLQQQISTKASEIRILTQLDSDLDSRTFELGDLYLGDLQVHVPSGRFAFDGDFDFVKTKGYVLHVSAGIDGATNTATWLVQAIDPNTGELVEGAFSGLLGDKGNGRVSYQIQPKQHLITGTEISTQARVFFNNAAPVDTQTITNTIDSVAPTSTVTATPIVVGSSDYLVKWTATDDVQGAGVKGTSIYVSDNGGDFTVWQSQTTAAEGVFKGIAGHSYEFLSLALDNAGNIENQQIKLRDLSSRLNTNNGDITVTGGGTPPVVVELPTNSLFTQVQQLIPAKVGNNPSGFSAVIKPFVASTVVKDLPLSNGGVGALAVLPVADGKVLVSGGANRGDLYLVDKLGTKQLITSLTTPIFDLAQDQNGTIWASTGGNQLLQLDPTTGQILGKYGTDLTQALAINPTTGKIYISSGDGIEIFDPGTQTFKHFSNQRVDSLAFNSDGSLWATSWAERGNILKFSVTGIPEIVVRTDKQLDSLAFGKLGSKLNNLLFVSSNNGELLAVDLKTKGIVQIASGGLRGEHLATTEDGKIYLAQGSHLDVLNPLLPPKVITTNPPNDGTVNLPNGKITIAFDSDMLVGTGVNSALDPKNYNLVSNNNGKIKIDSVTYDATTRTATLNIGAIKSDVYQLTLASNLQNLEGEILGEYQTKFTALNDLSTSIDLNFSNARLDRQFNTVAYDVSIRNRTDADLTLPAYLLLEPNLGVTGKPVDATNRDGNYLIDLSSGLTNGILKAGQTINSRTIIVKDPDRIRVDFGTSVYAMALPNQAPVVNSTAITQAKVGQLYQYQVNATDADSAPGSNLGYLLLAAPTGMVINNTTGLISWTPTAANNIKSAVTLRVYDSRGGYSDTKFNINVAGGNNAPTFVNQPSQITGREGTKLELKINAQDLDKNSLEYWANNLPGGAVFNPTTRTLTWIPDAQSAGTYNLDFYISDGIETVKQTVTLSIAPTNQAPTLAAVANRTLLEGETVKFQLQGQDLDGDKLTYSSNLLPAGATLDPITGVFSWTPGYTAAGVLTVPFLVSDGKTTAKVDVKLTVLNANAAPVFDKLDKWEIQAGQTVRFRAFALDPDNPGFIPQDRLLAGTLTTIEGTRPSVTYTASNLPTGATFDAETGLFSWDSSLTSEGNYTVTFTATDDGNGTGVTKSSTISVPIIVLPTDRLPIITAIANQTIQRGDIIDIPVVATDANGDPLALSGTGTTGYTLPDFVTFTDNGNGTGVFHITPDINTNSGDYTIYLTATENRIVPLGAENSTTTNFLLTLNAPNDRPKFSYQGDLVAIPVTEIAIPIYVVDKNQDALTYSISGLPPGAVITPTSTYGKAILTWTPTDADLNTYPVTITVTDVPTARFPNTPVPESLSNTQTFNLVVRSTNAAPVLGIIGNRTTSEESKLTFQLSGTDLDADKLTYTATNLPTGSKLDPQTGLFTWTPIAGQAGDYSVKFTTSDGNKSNSETVKLTVTHTNHNPILTPLPLQRGSEQKTLTFNLIGNDVDGDSLLFTIDSVKRDGVSTSIPQGVYLDQNSGKFVWTPSYNQAGEYTFKFATIDAYGGRDSKEIKVLIDNVDRAPTLNISDRGITIGKEVKFVLDGKDLDLNTVLTYATNDLPAGATLNASTGEFKWTPTAGQLGSYIINFSVSDGEIVTSKTATIKVQNRIEPPKVTLDITPSFPVLPGQKVIVTTLADSIADIADIKVKVDGVLVDSFKYNSSRNGGNFTFTSSQTGRHQLEIIATDVDGQITKIDKVIKVKDPADTAAPFVELASGLNGAKLTANTQITGQIVDTNLDEWKLEIAELGTDNYRVVTSGYTPVLTTYNLQPTTYQNGFYNIRLTATDISGRTSVSNAVVEVNTVTKSGYQNTTTDLSLTLGGIPVNLTRHYDANTGNWTFNYDPHIQLNLIAGVGNSQPLVNGTRLYLTTPTGERVGFTFAPVKQVVAGGAYYTPNWVADAGVNYTLQSVDAKLMLAGGKFYDLETAIPYNPGSGGSQGAEYTLIATNGTKYELDAQRGLVGQIAANGTKLIYSDSGIITLSPLPLPLSPETVQFVKDSTGNIIQVIAPNGTQLSYEYNAQGDLVSVRNSATGEVQKYGYETAPTAAQNSSIQRLTVISSNTTGGVIINYGGTDTTTPITQELGGIANFNGQTITTTTATRQVYSFNLKLAELNTTNSHTVLIGVEGAGDVLINGVAPVYTSGNYRIFAVDKAGINLLEITNPGATFKLSLVGDLNSDNRVDGVDTQLLTSTSYDLNRDGVSNALDLQLLGGNYGFVGNSAPVITPVVSLTHVDLTARIDLSKLAVDGEGDKVGFTVKSGVHGQVEISADGKYAIFTPDRGYGGTGGFELIASDGFSRSKANIDVNVSTAALVNLDITNRNPKLAVGDRYQLEFTGDFVDQKGVSLTTDYLSYGIINSSQPNVLTVDSQGLITAVGDGTGVITASRNGISAFTATRVGKLDPQNQLELQVFDAENKGFNLYPQAVTLIPGVNRKIQVGINGKPANPEVLSLGTIAILFDL